ncbi:MAG: glycosyltransferase family 39 protein [Candidatus Omnitrophica bacterium]|nr:glycosyltransferase family 39 protein [Candidatus Omnitrophota bacterium]
MHLLKFRKTGPAILFILGALILLLLLNAAMKNTFEFDPDEGTYLVIAKLSLQGFKLYSQIWNDQPPLFTELLSSWFRIFGASAYSGRFFNLIFSLFLLWGLYRIIKLRSGSSAALAAGIFLILSQGFLRLGISIMPGLPSLTLAVLSLYSATIYSGSKSKPALFISSAFMAFALATKFSSIILAPSVFLEIGRAEEKTDRPFPARPKNFILPFFWLISSLVFYICFMWPYFYLNLNLFAEQLFSPHLAKLNIPGADFNVIFAQLLLDYDLVLLGAVAVFTNLRSGARRNILLPAVWLGLAITCFVIHRPIWYHYYLLVSIPLCWLAAVALGQFLERKNGKNPKRFLYYLSFALVVLAMARIPFKFIDGCLILKEPPIGEEKRILDLISKFKKDGQWMFTDLSIFAFSSNILVPPETAVLTQKNPPTTKLAASVLKKYKPELILLGRFTDYDRQMISEIQKDYRKESEITIFRPGSFPVSSWLPIAVFLTPRIQYPVNKWLRRLNWQPKILITERIGFFYTQNLTLFIRKNNADQF